jgi:hypothetical protein
MPLILNKRNRFAFLFGRRSGIRSTSEVVDQLQAQLAARVPKKSATKRNLPRRNTAAAEALSRLTTHRPAQ